MIKTIIGILSLALLITAAPIDDIGPLQVNGNQIVGTNGNPAQLMGMSFYHGQHKAGRDFVKGSVVEDLAKNWRCSVVRIPMMYRSEWGEGGGKGYDQDPVNSVKMVDTIIQAAIDFGIYVVVDWHEVAPVGNQEKAIEFFTDIAQRWGAYPNIIYEVFNEPTQSSWDQIKSYALPVINAIRQHDPENLIVVGTGDWCQQVMEPANDPINDQNNIAYSLHFYASDIWHQDFRARADSAMDKGIALFVTEWGNSEASGGGNLNQGYMDTFMNWMLDKKLCWCNWSLSDIPESSAALRNGSWNSEGLITHVVSTDGNWSDSDLSQSGLFVRNVLLNNRPAYTPVKGVSVFFNTKPQSGHDIFAVYNSGTIELRTNSEKWTRAELIGIDGSVFDSKKMNYNGSRISFSIKRRANSFSLLRLKDSHGNSQIIKIISTR
ncbi:MAG TPA: glycoside hydrolase family 5 protein [Chitinispirillaceae bacterium]|nr:glycoside hydrolase family 5 protein [Chitinispirillaceae bacterium]